MITLTVGQTVLDLDPDLQWTDEFDWHKVDQSVARSLAGAAIIEHMLRDNSGRPITLSPPDDQSAWMPRSTITQLAAWEADPSIVATLNLRGVSYQVIFRRHDGTPIDARPVTFVANPIAGGFGDWYFVTIRMMVLS